MTREEEILCGWLKLPGRKGKSYVGKETPQWKEFPKENQDMEAVFVLNRHEHWNILMEAYQRTGDERYADRVWKEFESWYQECPCPEIKPDRAYLKKWFDTYRDPEKACWRSLEAGIRMFRVWPNIPKYLFHSKNVKKEYICHFKESLIQHARVLSTVSPAFFPKADHNHYLMETFGLLTLGCVYPWLRERDTWREQAVKELKRCFMAQITEDGGQIEGCPYYHNETIGLMAEAVLLMKSYQIPVEDIYLQRLKKSLEYTLYTVRPTGKNVAFGDSDAADTWKKALKLGGKAFGREEFARWESKEKAVSLPPLNYQRELGQVFVRSHWGRDAASLAVICKAPVQNEHAHIDGGSFEFTAFGKTMLTDPGRYTYQEGEVRKLFKSAEYHNTLLVNGKSPFNYIGTWKYGEQKPACITEVTPGFIHMHQEAYAPAIHERRIYYQLSEPCPWLLIRDDITNLKRGDFVELYYHLDFTRIEELPDRTGVCAEDFREQVRCIIRISPETEKKILAGKVSEAMDSCHESRRLVCRAVSRGQKVLRLYTLIVPEKIDLQEEQRH